MRLSAAAFKTELIAIEEHGQIVTRSLQLQKNVPTKPGML